MLSPRRSEQYQQSAAASIFGPGLAESQDIISLRKPAADPGFQHWFMISGAKPFTVNYPDAAKAPFVVVIEKCNQFPPRLLAGEAMQVQLRLNSHVAARQPE
jgi:hypothetical protein